MRNRRSRGTSTLWASSPRLSLIFLALASVNGQSVPGRWGQSSLILSPNSTPHLLITSGKSFIAGQTLSSTPSTSSLISLDLSQPISDLSNPPWTTLEGNGPIASWGSLVAMNEGEAVYFGGDATGDPTVPVQTRNDSSWLLNLSSSSSSNSISATWTSKTSDPTWNQQPERRQLSFSTSASNGLVTRTWIYGGSRADGSGIGFDELWELQVDLETKEVEWARSTSTGGPGLGGMYDGMAVLVPTKGEEPSIYFLGGVESSSNLLTSFGQVYSFTPSTTIGSGTWSTITLTTTTNPTARRGHSAVYLGNGKIWISGGRDLTGSIVYKDSWVLDLGEKSWERVSDANEASWGASTVVLGETILTSFGYGLDSPASTQLKVYAFENDTWLDSYQPSYLSQLPTNPKATSSSSDPPSSASSSTTGSTSSGSDNSETSSSGSPSNPKAHGQPGSSSSDTPSDSSSSSSSSSTSSSNSGTNSNDSNGSNWSSPGTPHSPSDSSSDSGKDKSHSDGGGTSKSLMAGAVVGSVLGVLALAAVGVYGFRKRKRGGEYHYSRKRGGAGGLTAFVAGAAGGGGRYKRKRFDMLEDEEEGGEKENFGNHLALGGGGGSFGRSSERGWTRFDQEDEREEEYSDMRERVASDLSDESARIGVGIWGGLGRSESVKSVQSYLGNNLGGFLRSSESTRESIGYGGVGRGEMGNGQGDASLTPIAEWDEDRDGDEDEDGTVESGFGGGYALGGLGRSGTRSTETHEEARSTETHQTRSTWTSTSHENASIKVATRVVRPFSPASSSSLYGSGFVTPTPFTVPTDGIARSTSNSSSLFLSPVVRRDNSSSWWSHLKHHQPSDIPSATAFEAIRDPAPAPNLDSIPERDRPVDPFSDPTPPTDSLNEHGLMAARAVRGVHDRSISSNVSEVTATSSILEERMRGMDVVQRIRTGEGSDGSGSVGTGGGNSTQVTPEISQDPFSDPTTTPYSYPGNRTPGSVIFAGSQAAFSPRPESPPPPVPAIPPFPLLPVILPPTPTRSQSPPHSPRKARLMGPRPQPSQALPAIGRSGSVKNLVAEIERRNSLPLSSSTPILYSPNPSPSKRATRARTTGHSKTKVEHGLVKKPKLYVANP